MKKKDLLDALNDVSDKHLEETEEIRGQKKRKFPLFKIIAPIAVAAGVFIYFAGSFFGNSNEEGSISNKLDSHVLAQAEYPSLSKQPIEEDYMLKNGEIDYDKLNKDFDKWYEDQTKIEISRDPEVVYKGFKEFLKKANEVMFAEAKDKNMVYSPLNIYMATSMLAELADGNTEKQILELLNESSIEEIRENAKDIWKDNYQDDGKSTSILANSMWTQEGREYNKETLAELTKNYYASLYEGKFGTEDYNQALRDWINKNTKDLLKDSAENLKFNESTVMALVSTIYFTDQWTEEFDPAQNTTEIFKSPSGDQEVEFMNATIETIGYEGVNFWAADLSYANGGVMRFIKPKDGDTLEDVMKSEDLQKLFDNYNTYENYKELDVNFKVPKFDITSDIDMIEAMKSMGLTDVFDPSKSDLSKLMSNENSMFVDQFLHSARVKIDEQGTEAAAYTVIAVEETAMIEDLDEMDMFLDEPFIFSITNRNGATTFVGVVNSVE